MKHAARAIVSPLGRHAVPPTRPCADLPLSGLLVTDALALPAVHQAVVCTACAAWRRLQRPDRVIATPYQMRLSKISTGCDGSSRTTGVDVGGGRERGAIAALGRCDDGHGAPPPGMAVAGQRSLSPEPAVDPDS
jgi:hypothetical protein